MESHSIIEEVLGDGVEISPSDNNGYPLAVSSSMKPNMANYSKREIRSPRRQRPSIQLDDQKCRELIDKLFKNQELQQKVSQIQALKAQIDSDSCKNRMKNHTSHAHPEQSYESGDFSFSGIPIVVEPDDSEECVGDTRHNIVSDSSVAIECVEVLEGIDASSNTLTDTNRSFTQSIVEWVVNNREQVSNHVQTGSHLTRELAVGNVTGYVTACLVKKFGKIALWSLVGGLVFVKIAHSRGYINIDWNRLCNELKEEEVQHASQMSIEEVSDVLQDSWEASKFRLGFIGQDISTKEEEVWITKKVRIAKDWVTDNNYLVGGFVCGFLFKSFSSQ